MIRQVEKQPEQLVGHHYRDFPAFYEWFECVNEGTVYAVVGMSVYGNVAMLYWRILAPSVSAWKDLRKVSVPQLKARARERGATVAVVSTEDKADTNFDKMVAFMGFDYMKKTAAQGL